MNNWRGMDLMISTPVIRSYPSRYLAPSTVLNLARRDDIAELMADVGVSMRLENNFQITLTCVQDTGCKL